MINYIDSLVSEMHSIVTEKQCVDLLKKYVVSDMWRNHKDTILEKLGNPMLYTERMFNGICESLYMDWYVNDNWYGNTSSSVNDVNWLMKEKLPPIYLQCFQMLSSIHKKIRHNCIYG